VNASINIAGKSFSVQSDDDYLTAVGDVFEPDMVSLFRHFARGTVLDIGANIGLTALAFAQMANRVHGFEPSPSTFEFLRKNTESIKAISIHNFGFGEQSGDFELTFSPTNRSGGFVSNQTQACGGHTIEKIRIETLDETVPQLAIDSIDFMKLDVEGFEGSVLRGGKQTIDQFRPVVALELNHWCLNAFQRTSVPDFLDFLRSIFPKLYAVQGLTYLDLHNTDESYVVMYHHILMMKYATLVGAFTDNQVASFLAATEHRIAD
jgi:FkbM family methyltransferase